MHTSKPNTHCSILTSSVYFWHYSASCIRQKHDYVKETWITSHVFKPIYCLAYCIYYIPDSCGNGYKNRYSSIIEEHKFVNNYGMKLILILYIPSTTVYNCKNLHVKNIFLIFKSTICKQFKTKPFVRTANTRPEVNKCNVVQM